MPVTCLIIIALIGLLMSFYSELNSQIIKNAGLRDKMYETREVVTIRLKDSLSYTLTEALEND